MKEFTAWNEKNERKQKKPNHIGQAFYSQTKNLLLDSHKVKISHQSEG